MPANGRWDLIRRLKVNVAVGGSACWLADGGPADGGPVDGGPADGGPVDGGPADGKQI